MRWLADAYQLSQVKSNGDTMRLHSEHPGPEVSLLLNVASKRARAFGNEGKAAFKAHGGGLCRCTYCVRHLMGGNDEHGLHIQANNHLKQPIMAYKELP